MIPTDGDAAVIVHPGIQAFDFPAALIFAGLVTACRSSLPALAAFPDTPGDDRLNSSFAQRATKGHGVVSTISHQLLGTLFGASTRTPYTDAVQQLQDRFSLVNRGGGDFDGQRQTIAIGHDMNRGPFALAAVAYVRAPLFAGTNVPSSRALAQSSLARSLSELNRASQMRSQVPSSCHRRNQRCAVESSARSRGRSHQRQPVRKTYKIALMTCRS